MKPILQINHKQRGERRDDLARRGHQSFPLTDYNYRPTADAEAISPTGRAAIKSPAFHKLSTEFLGAETSRDYVAELLFFLLITCLAVWPIVTMLIAVVRMIRNY
ncbi:MAG: hypothetical protein DME82_13280 [Verrucomicrobia bacterium]|nr:MAG: hypothetical protein DME82_13280 [Verrucomicrobiota bacterium]